MRSATCRGLLTQARDSWRSVTGQGRDVEERVKLAWRAGCTTSPGTTAGWPAPWRRCVAVRQGASRAGPGRAALLAPLPSAGQGRYGRASSPRGGGASRQCTHAPGMAVGGAALVPRGGDTRRAARDGAHGIGPLSLGGTHALHPATQQIHAAARLRAARARPGACPGGRRRPARRPAARSPARHQPRDAAAAIPSHSSAVRQSEQTMRCPHRGHRARDPGRLPHIRVWRDSEKPVARNA